MSIERVPQTFEEWVLTRPASDRLTAHGWNLAELAFAAGVASQQAACDEYARVVDEQRDLAFAACRRYEAVVEAARDLNEALIIPDGRALHVADLARCRDRLGAALAGLDGA